MNAHKLAIGDTIKIKYRCWCHADGDSWLADRWLRAIVIEAEPGERPLARLADGQTTEIRPYMTWRLVARAAQADTIYGPTRPEPVHLQARAA